MRILFLAHRLPYPPNKGDKIRSFHELKALSRRHEVDLFCFYDQPEDREYFADVRHYCREFYAEKISWIRSRSQALLAMCLGQPFTPAVFHSPTMARHIQEALHSRNYDLIFLFSSAMAPYVESASDVPRVLDMVDVDSDKWTQYAGHAHPPASWIWRAEGRRLGAAEQRWVRDFSLTLLCTRAETEILKRAAPGANIDTLENRLDMAYFDPNSVETTPEIRASQPYIIFTGSMDYFPNVDAVTFFHREVFPAIRQNLPTAQFVIAGRNPTNAVRALGRDSSVHVTGAVRDIRPYLLGAAAAVAPMRVARGVQNKILEAMAMGLPVAASRKAAMALPEELMRAVHVEDDPTALAAYLIDKLQNATGRIGEERSILLRYIETMQWEEQFEGIFLKYETVPASYCK
ncbi:MAG: TIGR03087 family PEP-CTERM/XrtA system glycosyltransferase [Candidatus Acidiferrales bacterium]